MDRDLEDRVDRDNAAQGRRLKGMLIMIREYLLLLTATLSLVPGAVPALAQPGFSGLEPAADALLGAGEGTLTGTVTGADSLTIDGSAVPLDAGGGFSYAFDLEEGQQVLQLVAEGVDGQTALLHALTVDTLAPALSVTAPSAPVVAASPLTVAGSVQEAHLASITVAGVVATVQASAWSAQVDLAEGPQTLTVRAEDTLGHVSILQVPLVLDSEPPTITVTENGAPFAGGLFARPVTPVISFSDATELIPENRLDGNLYVSGTPITAEGPHTLVATATDAAGWTTAVTFDFELDLTPPTLGAVTPGSGTILAASEVMLTLDAPGATLARVGSVSVSGSSPFSLGPVPLVEGVNDLLVEVFDAAGHRAQRTHRLSRDTTAPELQIGTPSDGDVVSSSLVRVAGTASDARLLEVLVGGQPANLLGTTFEALDVPLMDGANVIEVLATDSVGNQTSRQVTVTLDQAAPTFTVTANGAPLVSGSTFAEDVTLAVTLDDPTSTLEATLDGAPFTPPATVSTDGEHELSVTVRDVADLAASALYVFTLDRQRPAFGEVAPTDASVQAAAEVILTGTVTGAVLLTVDGQPANLFGTDFSAGPFSLADGERTFTLLARGANGLETSHQHRIVRDTAAPPIVVSSPAEGALTAAQTVDVSGTWSEPHPLRVSVGGVEAMLSGTTFLARRVALSEGVNSLEVVGEDVAGNQAELIRQVILDTEAPELVVSDPATDTQTPESSYLVRGTASDPHLDRVEVDGRLASLGGDGAWSVTVPLEEGANDLVASAFDALGHRTDVSLTLFRDSQAPSVQITVPEEEVSINASELEVRGAVDNEPGVSVKVNGLAAFVDQGTWSVTVPLAPGENVLTARAADAQGNEGVHTLVVTRDETAPRFVAEEPAAGALALPLGTVFRFDFTEPLAVPESGALSLVAAGQPVAFEAAVSGLSLVVTPTALLPPGAPVVLTLTAGLTDEAGNALESVPEPFAWTTSDTSAPAAPSVDPLPPSHLCAPSVTLLGTTEPAAIIEVSGGAAIARARAEEDGSFVLVSDLRPDRLNRLELTALDSEGDRSPATVLEVVQDCRGPGVQDASLSGDTLTLLFDEVVEPTSLAGAVQLTDGGGAVGLSEVTDGAAATLTLTRTLTGAAVLEVKTSVRDLAGNALLFPYVEVFGQAAGDSFFSGTVLDASTGRPLEGAWVRVTATGGQVLAEPVPQQTTAADGRVLLTLPAGTHDVTFAREGYAPVFRTLTTQAGEGTQVFDPRLQPASTATTVGATGGEVEDATRTDGARLEIPAGVLAGPTSLAITTLDEQALPALLPYGWSPRGGAWLDSAGELLAPAVLRLPVTSPDGTVLDVVQLDLATLQWTVVAQPAASEGMVSLGIPAQDAGVSAWVVVEADRGVTAPPAAVFDQVLGSAPAPAAGVVDSASITFDPSTVLATQRSRARVEYTLDADAPSGVPLTLWIEERLTLLGGAEHVSAPYPADLILYRDPAEEPASHFWLEPSEAARQEPVDVGSEVVTVRAYGDETVRGDVLGPDGGSVSNLEGDRVELPAGALTEPAAVILQRRAVSDLPLPAPRGGTLDGVIDLDLGPATLNVPASLVFALDPAPGAGTEGLLLEVLQLEGSWRYRAVAALEPSTEGWSTGVIDPADLPWPGLRESGLYAIVRLTAPHGYLRGEVVDSGGAPAEGIVVDSPDVDWLAITAVTGSYVLPLPQDGASHEVRFEDPATGDGILVTVPVDGARIDLDPALQAVGPYVLEITPADGATEVPLGQEPTVRFSEPVVRSSLEGEVQLLLAGEPVEIDLHHQSDLVRLVPRASLLPDTDYQIRAGSGVLDLAGHSLAGALMTSFRTQEDPTASSGNLDPARVRLRAPGVDGQATVIGLAGAVPGTSLVYVENLTSFTSTVSVTAAQDGSFTILVPASVGDRLLLHVVIEGGSEDLMVLGPFLSEDEKSALVGPEGARFTSADGLTVLVDEGTFEAPTWVRLEPRVIADGPLASAPEFEALIDFDIDFGGAEAQKPLKVRLPVASGQPTVGDYQLHRFVEVLGQRGFMLHAFLRLEDGHLTDEPEKAHKAAVSRPPTIESSVYPPPPRQRAWPYEQAKDLAEAPNRVFSVPDAWEKSAGPLPLSAPIHSPEKSGDAPPTSPNELTVGLGQPGHYRAVRAQIDLAYLAYPAIRPDLAAWNAAFEPPMISWLPQGVWERGPRYLLLPTPRAASASSTAQAKSAKSGTDAQVTVADTATGFILFEETRAAPEELLDIAGIDDYPDSTQPTLVAAGPFLVRNVQTGFEGTREVAQGIQATVNGASITITGEAGAADPDVGAVLWDYQAGQRLAAATTAATGAFALEATGFEVGRPLLLALGAVVGPFDAPHLEFSEAIVPPREDPEEGPEEEVLAPGITVIEVVDGNPRASTVTAKVSGGGELVRLHAPSGWRAGDYRLRLGPGLADAKGNPWQGSFELDFRVAQSSSVGTYELPRTADLARFGQLLLVAASERGLQILDVSHPRVPRPYLGVERGFVLSGAASVRGVEVDAHGFVYFVGGGESTFGVLKVLDLLALDPAAVTDAASADAAFAAAQRLSIPISNPVTTGHDLLPEGLPRRVAIASRDTQFDWIAGGAGPDGVTITKGGETDALLGDFRWTITGTGTPGRPVTLRNESRGRMARVMVEADGSFTLQVDAGEGDHLRLLANTMSVTYVSIDGAFDSSRHIAGLAAVDVGAAWEQDVVSPHVAAELVQWIAGASASVPDCDPFRPSVDRTPKDVAVLLDDDGAIKVATLIPGFGVRMLNGSSSLPFALVRRSATDACASVAEQGGRVFLAGMTAVADYPMEVAGVTEKRDYVLVSHLDGYVLIFDVTDPHNVDRVGQIPIGPPGVKVPISGLEVDRRSRRIYVTAFGNGVYVLDFDRLHSIAPNQPVLRLDADGDGVDDRVLEHIEIAGELATSIAAVPELGLVWAGGREHGITGLLQSAPEMHVVADGPLRRLRGVAPFGVPTSDSGEEPGVVRLLAALPGLGDSASSAASQGATVRVDLISTVPEGEEIDGVATGSLPAGTPPTSYRDDEALELRRLADRPYENGYRTYLSEPVVLIADLRASIAYQRSEDELDEELCRRCDQLAEGVYATVPPASGRKKELLSGYRLRARFAAANPGLTDFYQDLPILRLGANLGSVPWDLSPSPTQEPANNPSLGFGEVAPGTLLHSGEYSHSVTDLDMPALGIPFVFTRTYRNQTVGEGPLGPGWDFVYRQRLRELPDGDLDYFDGRGRRETFRLVADGEAGRRYRSPAGNFLHLVRTAQGFTIYDRAGARRLFDTHGRLRSFLDTSKINGDTGSEMVFEYDSHSRLSSLSVSGRRFALSYRDDGSLETLKDDTGREVSFEFDGEGRLQAVYSPELKLASDSSMLRLRTSYTYESTGSTWSQQVNRRDNLLTITDPRLETWLELQYLAGEDGKGHRLERQKWGGSLLFFEYLPEEEKVVVRDRRDNEFTFTHDGFGHLLNYRRPATTDSEGVTTGGESTAKWELGPYGKTHGLVSVFTTPRGQRTKMTYAKEAPSDAESTELSALSVPNLGRVEIEPASVPPMGLASTDPRCFAADTVHNGTASPMTWTYSGHHPRTQLPAVVTGPRSQRHHGFDGESGTDRGFLVDWFTEVTRSDETTQEIEAMLARDELGRVTEEIRARTEGGPVVRKTSYFGDSSLPSSIRVLPDADPIETRLHYDGIDVSDSRGFLVRIEEPMGGSSTYEVNALGWVLRACRDVTGENRCTSYAYDELGQLVEEKNLGPSGETVLETNIDYGALGEVRTLTVLADGVEIVEERDYDENLNLVSVDRTGSAPVSFEYDERNQRIRQVELGGSDEQVDTRYSYDSEGRVTQIVQKLETGPDRVWSTRYDGFGRPYLELGPIGHYRLTSYDDGGHPETVSHCSASGELLSRKSFTWDEAGRLIAETDLLFEDDQDPGRSLRTLTDYDEQGQVTRVVDPRGDVTVFTYDGAQRLISMRVGINAEDYREDYVLDDRGRTSILSRHYPPSADGNPPFLRTAYSYDGLDQLVQEIDGHGQVTERSYDALGRLVSEIRPEGQIRSWSYDGLGRLLRFTEPNDLETTWHYQDDIDTTTVRMTDALGQKTNFLYDGLGRLSSLTYPDGTEATYGYDEAGMLESIGQADGSEVTQGYDAANRLIQRTVTGPAGAVTTSYSYDGLDRMNSVTRGGVSTHQHYDSLSRLMSRETAGHAVAYRYDDLGQPTKLTYPSGQSVVQSFDALSQLEQVTFGSVSADFTWLGTLPHGLKIGSFEQSRRYDDRGLPVHSEATFASDRRMAEALAWDARGLLSSTIRHDLEGLRWEWGLDAAGRLLTAERSSGDDGGPSFSSPDSYVFDYDEAQNLLEVTRRGGRCQASTTRMPPDDSGRHRPASVSGEALVWDEGGRLIGKGPLSFTYDDQDQLLEVREGSNILASYRYDALGRRIKKTVEGVTYRTVWDGWRPIEVYEEGVAEPLSRRIYGRGLDEVVGLQQRRRDQASLSSYTPIYDTVGNLVALLDGSGAVLERYTYAPFGERFVWADSEPPAVEQIRLEDGLLVVELSEPVRDDRLLAGLGSLIQLENLTQAKMHPLSRTYPVTEGRLARRRVVFSTTEAIDGGDDLRLTIEPAALVDFFGHSAADSTDVEVTWQSSGREMLLDSSAPEIEEICLVAGKLVVDFSEAVDPASVAQRLLVDHASMTWVVSEDGYTAELSSSLTEGSHTLDLETGALDLAGKPLATQATFPFTMDPEGPSLSIYAAPYPGERTDSTVGVELGFHGLTHDGETGFVYARRRYLDPELGRFTTPDPLGFVDGPNLYQFALNNPVSFSDPMGLESVGIMQMVRDQRLLDPSTRAEELADRAASKEDVLQVLGNPYVQGSLQVIWGCTEAVAGGTAVWSGAGTVPGAVMLAHGGDMCVTGLRTLASGQTKETLFVQGVTGGLELAGVDPAYSGFIAAGIDIAVGVGSSVATLRASTRVSSEASTRVSINLSRGPNAIRQRVLANIAESSAARGASNFTAHTALTNLSSGNAYSVAFRTRLPSSAFPGRSRRIHFQESNRLLLEAMDARSELDAMMEALIPNLREQLVRPRSISREPPYGWTWHHHLDVGFMELVPRVQHTQGGPVQGLLHPNGRGGFSAWGRN
ncbi:MAG: Ig-like domain-containing protein [Thermoanaerobaculia bacterium]|nr:Ig-like domain-containing protein [Thermoanaerobaculia bacterium]